MFTAALTEWKRETVKWRRETGKCRGLKRQCKDVHSYGTCDNESSSNGLLH